MSYAERLANIEPVQSTYLVLKRIFDLLFAIVLLIPAGVIILLFSILVKLESRGPVFYKQARVGLLGREIQIIKIRSMYINAEENTGAVWAKKNDIRITRIGRFIRRTRIDELPQILSVLIGEMSFIGPRPERPLLTERFSDEVSGFEGRLAVKPGLSGLAQVRLGYDATPAEKLQDDLEYINEFSLKMDLRIALQTILVIITGHGAH